MLKAKRTYLLLLFIFIFSFVYRMLLMFWSNFPSGADIGLHNSVIYSITGSGNTNFMYNFYQMGGGASLTFPGYHIFASSIIMMTGMPEYAAQATVVALFSSLIVLCAFLITRSIWNESAAYIVAFLVAISRFDIEMLLWGGYPNVITLLLIPITFYLYLQKDRFTLTPFLASSSLLVSSIFLTHSLSSAIFIGATFITVLFVFISPKTFGISRKTGLYWLLPIVIGVILVLPFLMEAVPTYLSDNSSAPGVSGVNDITSAILSTRILPLEFVLPLFAIIAAFVLFSKKYKGRFLSLQSLLLSMWLFVPLFLTQGYLFGFIIDYNRFLYFIILPVLIFIGALIDHGSEFFTNLIQSYRNLASQVQKAKKISKNKIVRLSVHMANKTLYSSFVLFFLLFAFIALPIFMTPSQNIGETIQNYYQVMNNQGWKAIQWAKQNTPPNSVFVSDALYGWWFGGFAQRPTLSAVDPQYLTNARELAPAKNASNLLDTDYLVDNGLVQIREDGGYIARHNPEILATLNWTYFPYSFFTFNSNQIHIDYEVNGSLRSAYLDQLVTKEMRIENMPSDNDPQYSIITVIRGNDFFNYTQKTTMYKGLRFVDLTTTLDSTVLGVSLDWVYITVQSKGTQIPYNDNLTVGMIDEGVKAFGQLIFDIKPYNTKVTNGFPATIQIQYNLEGKSQGEIQISASAYSVTDNLSFYKDPATINSYFATIMTENLNSSPTPKDIKFEQVFNYRAEIQNYSISYIVCRVTEMYPKFFKDPLFDLVFINSELAIFKAKG
jgi:hypothetical protein